jgi:hypothetical protein
MVMIMNDPKKELNHETKEVKVQKKTWRLNDALVVNSLQSK